MNTKSVFGLTVASILATGACNSAVGNIGKETPCVDVPGAAGGHGGSGNGGGGGAPGCPANLLDCGGVCVDAKNDPAHCGTCDGVCASGQMCANGVCSDAVVCTPGSTRICYTGELATLGVGTCKAGTETCNATGTGWSACEGEVLPGTEDCSTLQDEDCDGQRNNECNYMSCLAIRDTIIGAPSGIYEIDVDGPGAGASFEVYCDMERDGGGWTLVMVSSDDGQDTWTWNNRTLMTTNKTLVGNVHETNKDFKSAALHLVLFQDLMFLHAPSFKWAAYANVGSGTSDIGTFMGVIPAPVCDLSLGGNGYHMTAGNLEKAGALCDTGLYFHLGDFDGTGDPNLCNDANAEWGGRTYGPCWSTGNNGGCPFDDPSDASLGPEGNLIQPNSTTTEMRGRGFGLALGLNIGSLGAADNYIQMYVR